MKFPDIGFENIGSIKARCRSHKNKTMFTASIITAFVFLIISLMWTPADAIYTTKGFGIYVDGERVVSTLTSKDANAILDGVAENYAREDTEVTWTGYLENVTIQTCEVVMEEVKTISDGIAYIINRENPLLTICSTQRDVVSEEIITNEANLLENNPDDAIGKIQGQEYQATREYTVLLTLENNRVVERKIIDEKLIVTVQEQVGHKVQNFTKGDTFTKTVEFVPPVEVNITSAFGASRNETGYHFGVDLYNPCGTPIRAGSDGVVTDVGYQGSYGNLIIIDHGGNVQTYYSHCSTMSVAVGDKVSSGDYIGTVGDTGRTTGYHLHFEIRVAGVPIDPMEYL